MYDYVYCHQKLPEVLIEGKIVTFTEEHPFQTKDFDCLMDYFHIDIHNRLLIKEAIWSIETEDYKDSPFEGPFSVLGFHGIFSFYTTYKTEENEYDIEYIAKYTDGFLVSITPKVEKLIFNYNPNENKPS